ncbi:MAG: hypothetical protein JKX73_08090 [Flavobacteriales bacterium]|nr:hypothetical protein [Flavobacteriales bacterium]
MDHVEERGLLEAPQRPVNIPDNALWLGGVGAGSWFALFHDESMGKFQYRIQRFGPGGDKECDGFFYLDNEIIDMNKPYQFTYLSHCAMCTIMQTGKKFVLEAIYYPAE